MQQVDAEKTTNSLSVAIIFPGLPGVHYDRVTETGDLIIPSPSSPSLSSTIIINSQQHKMFLHLLLCLMLVDSSLLRKITILVIFLMLVYSSPATVLIPSPLVICMMSVHCILLLKIKVIFLSGFQANVSASHHCLTKVLIINFSPESGPDINMLHVAPAIFID